MVPSRKRRGLDDYSTLCEFQNSSNSRKSGLSGIDSSPLLNCEEDFDPLLRRQIPTSQNVRGIGLRKGFKAECSFLHRFTILACLESPYRNTGSPINVASPAA